MNSLGQPLPGKDDHVLLMFSGGFDSAAVIVYLLKETECKLDVLHLTFSSKLGKIENRGCNRIVDYCKKNLRSFNYYEKLLDHFTTNVGMNQTREESAKWCNQAAKEGKVYRYIASGRCVVDMKGNFEERALMADRIFHKYLRNNLRKKTVYYFPILEWNKRKIVEYLPQEIIGDVWTCQRPHPTKIDWRGMDVNETRIPDTMLVGHCGGGDGYKIVRNVIRSKRGKVITKTSLDTRSQRPKKTKKPRLTRDFLYKTENFRPCQKCSSCKDIIKLIKKHPEVVDLHNNFVKYKTAN